MYGFGTFGTFHGERRKVTVVRLAVVLAADECAVLARYLGPAVRRARERGERVDPALLALVEQVAVVGRTWRVATSESGSAELPSIDLEVENEDDVLTLTVAEAAAQLEVSERRVTQLLATKKLQGRKAGGTWKVDANAVRRRMGVRSAS